MRTFRILRPHTALLGLRCHNVLLRRNLLPSSPLSISTCRQKNPQFTRHFCSVYPFKYQSSHSFKYQSSHSFKCQSSHSFKCQSSHSFRYYSSQESSAVNPDQSGDERDSSSLGSNPSFDQVPRARLAAAKWSDKEVDGEGKSGANSLNYGVPRRGDLGSVLLNNSKKKAKSKILWVCSNCGNSYGQWWGTCTSCNHVGTITQFSLGDSAVASHVSSGDFVTENKVGTWLPEQSLQNRPVRLRDVSRSINQMQWRIPLAGLFGAEVSRVLGGGVVPGSLILVGGDPGVGKSTLSLLIASIIAEANGASEQNSVLYVSGEESVEQIGNRADRMRIDTEHLFLYSSTDIEDILKKSQGVSARALIVDSIQTVYLKGVTGSPGGIQQVKECTSALLRFAKATNIPVLLIGHVNKSGEIAGPRVLEHIVDVVLYMEGEKHSSHRLLRSVKNRFGSTDELGVFEMSQSGLQAVANPSKIFLTEQYSDSEHLAGLAVAAIVDGSRTFLIEVQALCISGSNGGRHFNGVPTSRADMIISVLMKQAGLKLEGNAVFLNVVSGVSLTETAGDLAVAAAICSSYLEFPVPNNVSFIGEIGLGGELRMVPRIEKRVNTVAKLGYKACIVPKSAEASLNSLGFADIEIIGCKNVKEVINKVFCNKK